jgi:hypothetical protein
MNEDDHDDRPIRGAIAIAKFRNEPPHRTFRYLDLGIIPAFKEGGVWCLRPSTQRAHHARLEAERRAEVVAARAAPAPPAPRGRGRPRKNPK